MAPVLRRTSLLLFLIVSPTGAKRGHVLFEIVLYLVTGLPCFNRFPNQIVSSVSTKSTIPYRADVDGLRALAVLPVLFFHAELGFPGGFVGVDIFFVISGFLIGSLVLSEVQSGTFRMMDFWERRVRRIFPALAVVVIATFLAGAIWMVPQHFAELGQSIISQPLLVANFYFWKQSGYFETAAEFQPLLHTWSLAVEEQFYLFFPLVMIFFMRWGIKMVRTAVVVFIAGSLAWSIYGSARYPDVSFFLIPSRIWELDLGVMLALLPKRKEANPLLDNLLGWSGIVAIACAVFFYDVNTTFPGYAAALPCLGAVLLIFSNSHSPNSTGRLLGTAPLVFIGKISYSLYLWHWPVIVFLKYTLITEVSSAHLAGALALSFVLACVSWKYVEVPFRQKSLCGKRKQLFAVAGALSVLFVIAGTVLYKTDGIPGRFPEAVSRHKRIPSPFDNIARLNQLVETGNLPAVGGDPESVSKKMVLWGDSHAMCLLPSFDKLGKDHQVAIYAAVEPGICPIAETYSAGDAHDNLDPGSSVLKFVEANDIKQVLMISRWDVYVFGMPGGDKGRLLCDAEIRSKTPGESARLFVKYLRKSVTRLNEMGVSVSLMRDVGMQPRSVPETVAQAASRGMDLNSFAVNASGIRERGKPINRLIDEALEGLDVTILDPIPYLTDDSGLYLMAKDGKATFNDRDHLSPFGSTLLVPLLEPVIAATAGAAAE